MNLPTNYFVEKGQYENEVNLRQAEMLVNASLLTSIFSLSYLFLSLFISFQPGIWLMIFNVLGFFTIPFLLKWGFSKNLLSHLFIFSGALAVFVLAFFSGGTLSPIFPWFISVPVLAILLVGKKPAFPWVLVALLMLMCFFILKAVDYEFPIDYDQNFTLVFTGICYAGLILILFVISVVFVNSRDAAVSDLIAKNQELEKAKLNLSEFNEELSNKSIELEETNLENEFIIQMLSHDLRSPLARIIGISEILESKITDKEQLELIDYISKSASKLNQLIIHVLKVNELGHKKLTPHLVQGYFKDILCEVVDELKPKANDKSISIDLKAVENTKFYFDAIYLHQTLSNLLSNAIKYSESNTEIRIYSEQKGNYVFIYIQDQGPGIPKEDQKLLFKKFAKLSNIPTSGELSTGLGLALVKKYTESMQGEVYYETSNEGGAIFSLKFPVA
jgi:signal transduction histidine kinase